ncbi:MAG: PHP domain-containing protein [Ruminococcus sp.]|nr:PHP domain-containing protein [Ruminococcus sp.]
MILYDLHTHSTASDGTDSPAGLIEKAHSLGLTAIALTDHDTVKGCAEAGAAAQKAGLRFIPGVEITGREHHQLHILGLGVDVNNSDLLSALDRCTRTRFERTHLICEHLAKQGIILDADKINASAGNAGKPHIAREMMALGYVSGIQEAFDRYLDTPGVNAIKKYRVPYAETAELIHGAGGLAVLAHPYQMKLSDAELDEFTGAFKAAGLDAIEVYYSRHTLQMAMQYLELAGKYGLMISCGSDYHGTVKPDIALGTGAEGSLIRLREQLQADEGRYLINAL